MNHASPVSRYAEFHASVRGRISIVASRDAAKKDLLASVVFDTEQIGTVEKLCESSYLAAVRLYRRERWQRALEQFARLAEEGSAPAAKCALLMLRHSNTLYGATFLAQPAQVARWALYVFGGSHRALRSHQD
jgi:hypothetical protein